MYTNNSSKTTYWGSVEIHTSLEGTRNNRTRVGIGNAHNGRFGKAEVTAAVAVAEGTLDWNTLGIPGTEVAGTDTRVAVAVEVHRNRRIGTVVVGLVLVARRGNRLLIHTLTKNQINRNRSEPWNPIKPSEFKIQQYYVTSTHNKSQAVIGFLAITWFLGI